MAGQGRSGRSGAVASTAMDPIDGDPVPAEAAPPEAHRRRPRRVQAGVRQLPWRRLVNPFRPLEILSADHVEAVHARVAADPLGDRHRDPRRPGAGRFPGRRRDRRRRDATGPARSRACRDPDRDSAERVHAPRPQPGARRRVRRPERRDQRGRRAGVRHGPRPRPAAGQLRRLPGLRPRHRGARHRPPGGRRPARAERPAGPDAPPRHVPDLRDDPRQDLAVPGLRRDRRRRRARGRLDRPRRGPRAARRGAEPDDDHQHQLAAPARRADERRPDRDGDVGPAGRRDAVHAGRGDEPGVARGRARAAERGSALPGGARPDRPPRRADGLRGVHLQRRHAHRLAGLRDPRVGQEPARQRPDGAALRPPVAVLERDRLEHGGCPGGVRGRDGGLGRPDGRGQPALPGRRLARGRADRVVREAHRRRGDPADDGRGHAAAPRRRGEPGLRRDRRRRPGRALLLDRRTRSSATRPRSTSR